MVDLLSRFPEILPREPGSVFRRFVEAHEEELEEYEDEIKSIKVSRQVDEATGDDLDRIGKLFGDVGRRLGRDDDGYRKYLKSVVQAFSGRGTDLAMRRAFAAALDVDVDDVELIEDTTNVEYEVLLHDWSDHRVSTIYDIAEIVDPSGVAQSNLRYNNLGDEAGASDAVRITEGLSISDSASASDALTIDPNLTELIDSMAVNEEALVDEGLTTVDDSAEADDTTVKMERLSGKAHWDEERVDWNFFEWAVLEELVRSQLEEIGSTDAHSINPNLTTVDGGTGGSTDGYSIDPNLTTVNGGTGGSTDSHSINPNLVESADTGFVDESVSVDINTYSSTDNGGSSDVVTVSETYVAWDLATWGQFDWTKQHN